MFLTAKSGRNNLVRRTQRRKKVPHNIFRRIEVRKNVGLIFRSFAQKNKVQYMYFAFKKPKIRSGKCQE